MGAVPKLDIELVTEAELVTETEPVKETELVTEVMPEPSSVLDDMMDTAAIVTFNVPSAAATAAATLDIMW